MAAARPRAWALIDGEHHPAVVRAAIAAWSDRYDIERAIFVAGGDKADGTADYGVPVAAASDAAPAALGEPAVVVDLCDDDPPEGKLGRAARFLGRGIAVHGADYRLDPPSLVRYDASPSVAVIGTRKRVGKTAVAGHLARLLGPDGVVIVAMGRGGPAEPQVARPGTALGELLDRSRRGEHASSDYLEGAALAGVTTVGCRRAGVGLGGAVAYSTVPAAARVAAALAPRVTIFEGSGSAVPPVRCDRVVLVADGRGGDHAWRERADLVVRIGRDASLQPRAVDPPAGERLAFLTTGPAGAAEGLESRPAFVSTNLARRSALRADLERFAAGGCDGVLTELKAGAIDTAAEWAVARGLPVGFVANVPVGKGLDDALRGLLA